MRLLTKLLMKGGAGVTPVLNASLTSAVAPFGVVFDGVSTTVSSGDAFHDYIYFFDFGDGAAATYSSGQLAGQTKNEFVGGPVASFVYETPGTYTAQMWVSDGVSVWGPVSQSITVTNPDTVYPTASTVCVSTSGTFTGAPAGCTQVTSSDFAAVMTAHAGSNKRILFRAGETFTTTAASTQNAVNNLYLGTFGGASQAVIQATATLPGSQMLRANGANNLANNCNGWRIHNLHFTRTLGGALADNGAISFAVIQDSGDISNISKGYTTIHNCQASNVSGFLTIGGIGNVYSKLQTTNMNEGVASSGTCSSFGNGHKKMGIVDCNFDNNHGIEHVLRFQGAEKSAIISNRMAKPPSGKHFLALRGWAIANPGYTSEWAVISSNFMDGQGSTVYTSISNQIAPQNGTAFEPIRNVIFENNFAVYKIPSLHLTLLAVNVSIRNNVTYNLADAGNTGFTSYVPTNATASLPEPSGIRIYNNTTYDANTVGNGSFVKLPSNLTGSFVFNNLYYAPGLTKNANNNTASGPYTIGGTRGTVFTPDTTTTGFTYGNNSTDVQCKSTDPLFVTPGTTQAGYKIQSGSYCKDAAVGVKVRVDALNFLRVGANFDIGALNAPDKQTDAWTLIP